MSSLSSMTFHSSSNGVMTHHVEFYSVFLKLGEDSALVLVNSFFFWPWRRTQPKSLHIHVSLNYPRGFAATIHCWTCRWRTLEANNVTGQDCQPLHAPAGFSREARVGFVLLGLLIGIEASLRAASAAGWFLERSFKTTTG
jgi:hypothetical protein